MNARGSAIAALLLLCGCVQKMAEDGHLRTYDEPQMSGHTSLVRHPPEGTIARGQLEKFPQPAHVTLAMLQRGQERYNIYCAPCHGLAGHGDGMIVQRGFLAPPSYHQEPLRGQPDQHYYEVITHGSGAMYDYAERVEPADRWAVIAYIRALQLSQNAAADRLPPEDRKRLEEIRQ
jgi:mono/diheme cytochrome c family protein